MKIKRFVKVGAAALAAAALAACSGGFRSIPQTSTGMAPQNLGSFRSGGVTPALMTPNVSKITLTPTSLALLGIGATGALSVTVNETGYTGTFTESGTCKTANIATASPTSGKGPKLTVKMTGVKVGSCTIVFTDSAKNTATLPVTVTTTSFKLTSASISPGSKSITITLTSVSGKPPPAGTKPATTTLPTCTTTCTVPGPLSPAGSDAFSLTIFDATGGTGNQLAKGTLTFTVAAGKANLGQPVPLLKIPKFLVFGTVPSSTAGTAYGSPQTLPLSIQDADHHAIAGTYSTAVKVTDSDTSSLTQGSSLTVNGGAASRSVSLTKSTDALKVNYLGLAMLAVTLSASATGATGGTAQFKPTLPPINYSGPLVGGLPEIDLYNTTSGQPGFAGTFTDTQPGWNGGAFSNKFTYALAGTSNNCSSYAVSPGSGLANAYTVQVGASPVAGKCTMTVTGGAGIVSVVQLTYSTTGIVIGLRHAKP